MAHRPFAPLRHPDFRRLWLGQLVSVTGSQMQLTAIGWHVYLLTRSPLALGTVGLVRILPVVVFSLWGGLAADRHDRKRLMLAAQLVMAASATVLALLTAGGRDSLALVYATTALGAAASAFDGPSRQALVPRLVPVADLPGALSLNVAMYQAALIGGPALAGVLIARLAPAGGTAAASTSGLALIYGLNALSFGAVVVALLRMKASGAVEGGGEARAPAREALREGLRFVFRTPIMVSTMTLDFFATFFAGSLSLLPIVADQLLGSGAAGYGWLAAAPGIGALLGSLLASAAPLPRRQGVLLLWAVAVYGASTTVFGLSRVYALSFAALALSGLADALSTVIRQVVRQLVTPDALRGRMTSVNMLFFMGGPQLGELEAGLVASLFASAALGATVSIVSGGLLTVLLAGVVAVRFPIVREYRSAASGA